MLSRFLCSQHKNVLETFRENWQIKLLCCLCHHVETHRITVQKPISLVRLAVCVLEWVYYVFWNTHLGIKLLTREALSWKEMELDAFLPIEMSASCRIMATCFFQGGCKCAGCIASHIGFDVSWHINLAVVLVESAFERGHSRDQRNPNLFFTCVH